MATLAAIDACLSQAPVVVIAAGLLPSRAAEVGRALVAAGVTIIEVPLRGNDVDAALESVRVLVQAVGDRALVGAGTVLTTEMVDAVASVGARLIVSPNFDRHVVERTKELGLVSIPGVFSPSEAFAALSAGADALKWFPTDGLSPKTLKAMIAVLPNKTRVLAVGGVGVDNVSAWAATGAAGYGIGGAIWKPSFTTAEVSKHAAAFLAAALTARGVGPPSVEAEALSVALAKVATAKPGSRTQLITCDLVASVCRSRVLLVAAAVGATLLLRSSRS